MLIHTHTEAGMKEYLGDSVYADFDGYGVTLTTENGRPGDPSNTICLGPHEIDALNRFFKQAINPAP